MTRRLSEEEQLASLRKKEAWQWEQERQGEERDRREWEKRHQQNLARSQKMFQNQVSLDLILIAQINSEEHFLRCPVLSSSSLGSRLPGSRWRRGWQPRSWPCCETKRNGGNEGHSCRPVPGGWGFWWQSLQSSTLTGTRITGLAIVAIIQLYLDPIPFTPTGSSHQNNQFGNITAIIQVVLVVRAS